MKNDIQYQTEIEMNNMIILALYHTSAILELSTKMYAGAKLDMKISQYKRCFKAFDQIHKEFTDKSKLITESLKSIYEQSIR